MATPAPSTVDAVNMAVQPAASGAMPIGGQSGIYSPGPQAQTSLRGTKPGYYIPFNQYTPYQVSPINNMGDLLSNRHQMLSQLIPTSVNVRNLELSQLLARMNQPFGQVYGGQYAEQAANQFSQGQGQLASDAARRGMLQSGAYQAGSRANQAGLLSGEASAALQGQQAQDQRYLAQLSQLFNIPEQDINFNSALRGGTYAAGGLFAPQNFGWPQVAGGIAQFVRSAASEGAGGAAGGGAGASFAGSGGMSSFGDSLGSMGYGGGMSGIGGGSLGEGTFGGGMSFPGGTGGGGGGMFGSASPYIQSALTYTGGY
jgi:hypothetical protein